MTKFHLAKLAELKTWRAKHSPKSPMPRLIAVAASLKPGEPFPDLEPLKFG